MSLASFSVHKMSASHLPFFCGSVIIHNYYNVTLGLEITPEQLAKLILKAIWVGFHLIHRTYCLFSPRSPSEVRRKGTEMVRILKVHSALLPIVLPALQPCRLLLHSRALLEVPCAAAPIPHVHHWNVHPGTRRVWRSVSVCVGM